MRVITSALLAAIAVYKRCVSPLLGERCRFYPSCADYAAQAVREKGAARGIAMGVFRLLRCHPFCQGGYDPVHKE
ncbi:MAG: membrane protein insertion efficiency factor YidD [Rickettsiales bacterium]